MLVAQLLQDQAARHPDRLAVVVDGESSMTYQAWETDSNRTARVLQRAGVQPGDRIGLLFGNDEAPTYLSTYVGIHKAGAVAVPLNTRFTPVELRHVVDHSGATTLLHTPRYADLVRGLDLGLVLDGPALQAAGATEDTAHHRVQRQPEDLADLLYTSGTTGEPKGVACTHDNISFKGSSQLSQAFEGAHFLHSVPLFTFAGTHAMSLICLRGAMTQVLQSRFEAGRFLECLAEYRVSLAYAVPSMLLRCLEHPRLQQGGFDALKLLMYGTAPMPPAAIEQLARRLPETFLLNLYGLTEGGAAVCSLPPHEALARPGSVGRPLPPAEVRIVDEKGQPLAAREHGEICMRAPIRSRWYYRDEAATATAWDRDGWLRTGDIGYLDEDGYLYLVDRKKDLVIVGGHNVSAPEVENVLIQHPDVRDAAVVGVEHPVLGEVPRAHVVLREGATTDGAQLQAFLSEQLADYKVPRDYRMETELPRNALGKVLKRQLREPANHAEAEPTLHAAPAHRSGP